MISSLQTSSSVRRPDVCRPGMDKNPKTVVFKAGPSIIMQHRGSYGSRTRFLSVPTKLSWVRHFSKWLYDQCICEVKHYHGDNGIFSAEEFRRDCEDKQQSQSFSGVGAQHQNARAERAIQTIMYMARTFMVHASLHWTESLWSFAVKHSVWVYI